ncbi:MAG TPA: hypothetical protein VFW87_24565 [Pirellulales bacterium]|nr:hypothetical protein [Pirellulales bacterium]
MGFCAPGIPDRTEERIELDVGALNEPNDCDVGARYMLLALMPGADIRGARVLRDAFVFRALPPRPAGGW